LVVAQLICRRHPNQPRFARLNRSRVLAEAENHLREESKFVCGFNSISSSAPWVENFSLSIFPKLMLLFARPALTEGRFAIVTSVGCGMRWTLVVHETNAPTRRRSRVDLVSSTFPAFEKCKKSLAK